MGKKRWSLVLGACLVSVCTAMEAGAAVLDLSGQWTVRLDPLEIGESERWFEGLENGTPIRLPGIATEVGLGEPLALEPALTKEVFRHLHQKYRYVGAAWYVREVELPLELKNQDATLLLERAIWKTSVWVNGHPAGSQDSLSTPHRHSVGAFLRPGKNTIAVRVDNRAVVDIGTMGHAYTDETQTIWNGLIGRMELRFGDSIQIRIHPLRVAVAGAGELTVQVVPENHAGPAWPVWSKTVYGGEVEIDLPLDNAVKWSEFNPALYRVTCRFQGVEKSIVTGFVEVLADKKTITVNGNPAFMRGTLECCIFPKTGYPPMDAAGWDKVFSTAKNHGLNHLRFHSWCPPEAAFASADRHGVYLQVELPNWTFKMGQRPEVDAFLMREGERIIQEYGHHPSFVFFSMGNELAGDLAHLDAMIRHFRTLAPQLLYTGTTYSFSPRGLLPGPADDFFISQKTKSGWVRGQGFLNQTPPNTDSDYLAGQECLGIPLITHEVGQYTVFPNLAELPKYDGNLRALNFEAIQQDLQAKGRLDEAAAYTRNSGKLAALLYKEDIERALRTPGISGIQLLDLHDFPGQSTATVGLLDAFWDSKGIIAPEEFRRFCAPVVPLLNMEKMVWRNNETFTAQIELSNFSSAPAKPLATRWKVADESETILAEGNKEQIEFPLSTIRKAVQLNVAVSVPGTEYSNDWNIWVYPSTTVAPDGEVVVVRRFGAPLFDALSAGKKVLFLPRREEIADPLDGRFIPVFWSPLHFPNQPGSLGTVIDEAHPMFADFPTASHTDWQWWELLATSTSVNADALGADFKPAMQFIDKYNRNSLPAILWEAKVGAGSLLVCSLDLESDPATRPVAGQLKQSILAYMNSDRFSPSWSMASRTLSALFQAQPYRVRLEKGTAHPDHPLANLQDGKAGTLWHSDWRDAASHYPYSILFELAEPMVVAGLDYAPRSDNNRNGTMAGYRVSASLDGTTWKTMQEGKNPPQKIRFGQPCKALAIRFEALSEVDGKAFCAIAELVPVFADGTTGVDELGLIEGFNTPE